MRELRRVAVLAGVLGQVAAAVAGVLPWPLLPVAVVLYAAGAVVSERADARRARVLRTVATVLSLVFAAAALPGVSADRDELRISLGLLLVGVQVVHALTWRVRRDLEAALGIAAALLVLGASFAPDVLVGLPMVAGWAAVVAGVVLASWQRMGEGTDGVAAGGVATGGRRPPLARVVAVALALGIAAFLVLPVDTEAAQRSPLGSLTGSLGATGAGGVRSNVYYSANRLDMRVRGTLSDRPVIEVPADSPSLWRAQVFPFYDGLRWAADPRRESVPGPPWVIGSPGDSDRTDRVVLRGRSDGTVWAPGEPVVVDAASGPGLVVNRLGGAVSAPGRLGDYTVTSSPLQLDPAVLRAAPAAAAVAPWLQLPATLPARVRALSTQLTAGAATSYDAVIAIEQWLRANATYQLDSPVPARNEDAVDRFLFVDRIGFCEQFAAAETVLLRAAGIPARLVTGLAAGVPADGRRLYREKDLHAWVEVLYPGVGWSSSDPTAGVPLAEGVGGSVRQRLVAAANRVLRSAESLPGGRPSLALLLVLAAVGVVALSGRRLPRAVRAVRRKGGAPRQPVPVGPALAAFLRYDARLGERGRRPAESLAELAHRLGPEPATAIAVVEAECYAPVPPPGAEQAAALLDRLETAGTRPGT